MNRRTFLAGAAVLGAAGVEAAVRPARIIDAHTHFYDPSRPQGVPWPSKKETLLYRTVLLPEFRKLTAPFGVTGTVIIEASPWLEDNQWVLDLAANDKFVVCTVGNLPAGKPEFAQNLARFTKNPLFRGIRLGQGPINGGVSRPEFIADLERLAAADLELDTLGGPAMLPGIVQLANCVPKLRIVIDHLPFDPPRDPAGRSAYESALKELGRFPQVYAKVSGILRRKGGQASTNLADYRPALDQLWETFGPDRVIYASNWPVSDNVGPYDAVFKVAYEYFAGKGQEAADKYFWKNALAAYKWSER